MKLLIENFKNFLHENDDAAFEKLRRLLLNGSVISAFELAATIDDKLLRDLLLEYSKMWYYASNSFKEFVDDEPEWVDTFVNSHDPMDSAELEKIVDKTEEILMAQDQYYDDDDLSEIYDMQHYIDARIEDVRWSEVK